MSTESERMLLRTKGEKEVTTLGRPVTKPQRYLQESNFTNTYHTDLSWETFIIQSLFHSAIDISACSELNLKFCSRMHCISLYPKFDVVWIFSIQLLWGWLCGLFSGMSSEVKCPPAEGNLNSWGGTWLSLIVLFNIPYFKKAGIDPRLIRLERCEWPQSKEVTCFCFSPDGRAQDSRKGFTISTLSFAFLFVHCPSLSLTWLMYWANIFQDRHAVRHWSRHFQSRHWPSRLVYLYIFLRPFVPPGTILLTFHRRLRMSAPAARRHAILHPMFRAPFMKSVNITSVHFQSHPSSTFASSNLVSVF